MPPKKPKSLKDSVGADDREHGSQPVSYLEQIALDPDFFLGTSKFEFPNGDKYEGEFCAHASGLVWRQGKGTYTTNEGQTYTGEWDGDKLMETHDVTITYPDGAKYIGNLNKNKYTGCGIYQVEENVSLMCEFLENKPTGEITLMDPNGNFWHGFSENDESLLIQEHPFYRKIGKDLGKGRAKRKPAKQKSEGSPESSKDTTKSSLQDYLKPPILRDFERDPTVVFAKSKLTPSDLQLDDSEWYQDYINYCNTYGGIIRRAKVNGEVYLTTDEYDWYQTYKEFEKKFWASLKEYKTKNKKGQIPKEDLFKQIHSEEYKLRTKSKPVFYPRQPSEDNCD